ncbi:MAG: amidohydrolase family protein [Rhodospirillaceae bacterium]
MRHPSRCRAKLAQFLFSLSLVTSLSLGPVAADSLLIENVTLIDGTGAGPLSGASVLVENDRIVLVSAGAISPPAHATVIDGTGKYLLPGLIDTHIHLAGGTILGRVMNNRGAAIKALHTFLYSGVTTVMDHGNDPDFIFPLRADEQAGRIQSPRILGVGWALHFPRNQGRNDGPKVIGSSAEVAPKLDAALAYDPDLIKLVVDPENVMSEDFVPVFPRLLSEIIQYTNKRGYGVTAHIHGREEFQSVLDAGVNNLAHAPLRNILDINALNSVTVRRVPISTTAVVFSNIARIADDASWFNTPLFRATLDDATFKFQTVDERERYRKSGMPEQFKPLIPNILENLRRLHESGALLALGSDRTYGPMTLQELELYVAAGIPLLDCITIATRNAALYIGKGDELGTVTRGKLADLILLRENPLKDVANFATVETVIKGGQRIDLSALDLPVND